VLINSLTNPIGTVLDTARLWELAGTECLLIFDKNYYGLTDNCILEKAGVAIDPGIDFGSGAEGYL